MAAEGTARSTRRCLLLGGLAGLATALAAAPVAAQRRPRSRIKAVASISIIADLVRNAGGDSVDVTMLVGPDSDAHVYAPTPGDAKKLAAADIVFVNGLGLEGWMTRLVEAAGSKAPTIVVSNGVAPRKLNDDRQSGRPDIDPHAWQSVANAEIYIANIRDALERIDPTSRVMVDASVADYMRRLEALDQEVRMRIARIPLDRRKVITTHAAFGYFGDAYGMQFIAPEGVSTDAEPSARDVARIIAQIRRGNIAAVFMENISDPRLMVQIARETGAKIGGTLYSDALSPPGGPAATYIDMMRHNVGELAAALTS